MDKKISCAIIAGEASGDTYGAALMKALRQQIPTISFLGAGGPKMQKVALQQTLSANANTTPHFAAAGEFPNDNNNPVFKFADACKVPGAERAQPRRVHEVLNEASTDATQPFAAVVEFNKGFEDWIAEAGVVGLWDVLKKYGYFRAKFSRFLKQLAQEKPEAIILIDYPGFNLRLAKAIRHRKLPIKIFYYISPQVWAWHQSRIPKMARLLDLMICIFPFEKELYEASGLPTTFMGHPLVETIKTAQKETAFLSREKNLLGLFPGSREREVRRLFPVMLQAAQRVVAMHPEVRCEAAAASEAHAILMQSMAQEAGMAINITSGEAPQLMQRAAFGLVCSGTATLEAACYGLPYALVYKVAWLTYAVGRQLIRVPFLGIINILAGRRVIKEFIQHDVTAETLAQEALHFLMNPQAAHQLTQELTQIVSTLHGQGAYERAATTMIESLQI